MLTIGAFLLSIAILVAVHEWGHFAMARFCGVQVLRFSVGFGPTLLRWKSQRTGTEFALAALPFGGFVRMLDEREGPVPAQDLPMAFNRKSLPRRAAIVAAGPAANLVLAVLLYALVNWAGVSQPEARIAQPLPESIAARAGLAAGDRVVQAAFDGDAPADVQSFEDLRWWLARAVLGSQDIRLEIAGSQGQQPRSVLLQTRGVDASLADASMYRRIGIVAPFSEPLIGDVLPDSAALAAGLLSGDRVLQVNGAPIAEAAQLREWIRQSVTEAAAQPQSWRVQRSGREVMLSVTPRRVTVEGQTIGRVGAMIGAPPAMVTVRFGAFQGLQRAVLHTWEISAVTLRMMGSIVTGSASLSNLSGPVTIADYAGKSAAMGLSQFVLFLALISISLGILNLLPIPALDGGHLMYYLWEAALGRPVPDVWLERLQRIGFAILLLLMSVALFNDVSRLFNP
jgi:regulator of sigma E protease